MGAESSLKKDYLKVATSHTEVAEAKGNRTQITQTPQGQFRTSIPKALADALGLSPDDEVEWRVVRESTTLAPEETPLIGVCIQGGKNRR